MTWDNFVICDKCEELWMYCECDDAPEKWQHLWDKINKDSNEGDSDE